MNYPATGTNALRFRIAARGGVSRRLPGLVETTAVRHGDSINEAFR